MPTPESVRAASLALHGFLTRSSHPLMDQAEIEALIVVLAYVTKAQPAIAHLTQPRDIAYDPTGCSECMDIADWLDPPADGGAT